MFPASHFTISAHRLAIQVVNIEEPEIVQIYYIICDGLKAALGCACFSKFWLFLTEQVFTLPLYWYEKGNQGAQEFAHETAKLAHP